MVPRLLLVYLHTPDPSLLTGGTLSFRKLREEATCGLNTESPSVVEVS